MYYEFVGLEILPKFIFVGHVPVYKVPVRANFKIPNTVWEINIKTQIPKNYLVAYTFI